MLRNAQYIEDHNIIYDDVNSFKKGRKAQVGWDVSVKNIYSVLYPGVVTKNKTYVPEYKLIKLEHIVYPYNLHVKDKLEFDGWFLPKGSYLIECNEGVQLGPNDTGYYIMRSSLNRCIVSINSALWDCGYTSQNEDVVNTVTLVIDVKSDDGFYLEKDARIAQLLIFENEDAEQYGGANSQFQGGRKESSK